MTSVKVITSPYFKARLTKGPMRLFSNNHQLNSGKLSAEKKPH